MLSCLLFSLNSRPEDLKQTAKSWNCVGPQQQQLRFLAKLLALELLLMGYWTNKQETEVSFMLQNCQAKNLSLHNDTSNNSVWKVKIVFLTLNQIFCYWLFCQLVNAPVHVAVWRFPTRLEHTSQSWCKPGYKMPTKLSLLSCTCFQSGTQLYIHFQRFFVPLQS